MKLSEIMKQIRKEKGWSMDKMAEYLGTVRSQIYNYENELSNPRDMVGVIAKLNNLGYKIDATIYYDRNRSVTLPLGCVLTGLNELSISE
jgi:transcriptional regulator with XRE-family HTH domain